MEWQHLVGIIIILTIIGIFAFTSTQIKEKEEKPVAQIEFTTLCSDWNRRYCTALESDWGRDDPARETGLEQIDKYRVSQGKPTLSDICKQTFLKEEDGLLPEETEWRSIITCQDVCKNNCLPEIKYDLAVSSLDITRHNWPYTADVSVHNAGSKTAYDVSVIITDSETEPIREIKHIDIPVFYSQDEYEIPEIELPEGCGADPSKQNPDKCMLCVNVSAETINEQKSNNYACNCFLKMVC